MERTVAETPTIEPTTNTLFGSCQIIGCARRPVWDVTGASGTQVACPNVEHIGHLVESARRRIVVDLRDDEETTVQ